uniref:Telomere length regulation protein conserved domain-containing protein n=1 Tax=Ditylenchus dipsaci TaxID=166011 RepID=A0A915DSC4_9BILA
MRFYKTTKMTVFSTDTFLSRVTTVNERATLVSVIGEFRQYLQDDQLKTVEYCAIVQAFLSQLKPSIFGQLTEQEFLNLFGSALSLKFPQDTISLLIHSIGVGDFYKFSKTLSLMDLLMSVALQEAFLLIHVNEAAGSSSDEQFSKDICSFPDRVYNFLGISLSSNEAVSVGQSIIQKFEHQLMRGIQLAFQPSVPLNISMCSKIMVAYCLVSDQFTKELLSWIFSGAGDSISKNFEWSQFFLNAELDYRRQEQLVIKLVHLTLNGDNLKKLFGDSPMRDPRVRRIFVKKLLVERLSPFSQAKQRTSQKIACYFASLGSALVASFIRSVSVSGFSRLCTATATMCRHSGLLQKIKKENFSEMRSEVMNFISSAIPEYLRMADITRRQMEYGLHFDYSEDWALTELRAIAAADEQVAEQKNFGAESFIGSSTLKENRKQKDVDFRALVLLDSDDDDDETCDKGEPLEAKANFSYLRECLDHLGAKESYINFQKALSALPRLLEQKSTGEPDLAQEILDRMVCLEDRFHIPEFSELRSEVTSLIFANHPELVAGAIRVLFSNQCCMSNRYFILACVEKAAQRLSVKAKYKSSITLCKEDHSSLDKSVIGKVVRKKSNLKPVEGAHLDLYHRDHILLGKILLTLGKLISYAKFAPSQIRIISSLFAMLYRVRSNKHGFVFNGVLFCYASIAESLEFQDLFTVELQDCMEWISEVAEEKVSVDPSIFPLVQTALNNIANVLKRE